MCTVLFLIPLPGGGGKEASAVKEKEKIIQDKDFYDEFFDKIEGHLETAIQDDPEPSEEQFFHREEALPADSEE